MSIVNCQFNVPRSARHRVPTRGGLTLFEVVISLGIFLGALAALGQLISVGARAAVQAQLQTEAVLRCQSKLAEILSGAEPLQTVSEMPFANEASGWTWSLMVREGPHADLLELELTVSYTDGPQGRSSGRSSAVGTGQNVSYTLRRYVRDPQLFLDAAVEKSAEIRE